MPIYKTPNPNQNLIDQFDKIFEGCSIDERGFRYLAAALRLGADSRFRMQSSFKIDVMQVLSSNAGWTEAIVRDFKRYNISKRLHESNFGFIGESKFEEFICNSYIDEIFGSNFANQLPGNRFSFNEKFSGLRLIFGNIGFSIREKIIFLFDAWDVAPSAKEIELRRLEVRVFEAQQLTQRCSWFDGKPDRLLAAYDHLKNASAGCSRFSDSDEIRIYFYKNSRENPEKVDLSIKKIQMLFNNRNSRATKATKQVNFSLSEKSIKNIKKLSMAQGENRSKIVDAVFGNDDLVRYMAEYLKRNGGYRQGWLPAGSSGV